jgi:hypothetical protein
MYNQARYGQVDVITGDYLAGKLVSDSPVPTMLRQKFRGKLGGEHPEKRAACMGQYSL